MSIVSGTGVEEAAAEEDGSRGYTPWYWLLVRDRVSGPEFFVEETPRGAVVLPVFRSEELAGVHLPDGGGPWRPRKTGRGELVSVLMGACRKAGWVTLDPPPDLTTEEALGLLGVSRDGFLDPLLGRDRAWFQTRDGRRRVPNRPGGATSGHGRGAGEIR